MMNKQGSRTGENVALRKSGGVFLQALRKSVGLTQHEVAVALNIKYYTMIAQIEAGTARIPPASYVAYAKIMNEDPKGFVKKLMQYYDPHTYKILWSQTDPKQRTVVMDGKTYRLTEIKQGE